jgi:hypothetical protein
MVSMHKKRLNYSLSPLTLNDEYTSIGDNHYGGILAGNPGSSWDTTIPLDVQAGRIPLPPLLRHWLWPWEYAAGLGCMPSEMLE